jgi:hypothetical protein
MRRRTLLAGLATGLVAGGCTSDPPPPRPVPAGPEPVVSQRWVGGLINPALPILNIPALVVYRDGLAIAEAGFQLRVSTAQVDDMMTGLIETLDDGAGNTRSFPPARDPQVDKPATEIVVRGVEHTYTVTVDEKVAAAWGRLGPLYRDARNGEPYRSPRVRVAVARREPYDVGTPLGWPADVAIPVIDGGKRHTTVDLDGAVATAALVFPRYPDTSEWQTFQTSTGEQVRAIARYLLPHE